jgi:ornithine carbamoyltransferase
MKDFLAISDYSHAQLQELLDLAVRLKSEWQSGGNAPLLQGKVLGMIFQKPSLRTRVSFDMAMRHVGGERYIYHRMRSDWVSANRLPTSRE